MRLPRSFISAFVGLLAMAAPAAAQTACALDRTAALPERQALRHDAARQAGLFRSQLRLNLDGASNAYHPHGAGCLAGRPCAQDRGLLHICNGVDVRDAANVEVPRVECTWPDGTVQPLPAGGRCPQGASASSQRCLDTFRAARDARFPACGSGQACVSRYFGILASGGRPVMQSAVHPRPGFYVSPTSLGRSEAAAPGGRGFVDSTRVPYITIPGRSVLAGEWGLVPGMSAGRAELALVVWRGRAIFAVVADTGNSWELGEASGALLRRLAGLEPADWVRPAAIGPGEPAVTLLLPGHADLLAGTWPLTEAAVQEAGREALRRTAERLGGWERIGACDAALPAARPS